MTVARLFLVLASSIAIPCAIATIVFNSVFHRPRKIILYLLATLTFALYIGCLVNAIVGLANSHYLDDPHACCWVAMGLGIGSLLVGLIGLVLTLALKKKTGHYCSSERHESNSNKYNKVQHVSTGLNYIEEIKQLKELLDCGAITQEEYDKKKKEILEK